MPQLTYLQPGQALPHPSQALSEPDGLLACGGSLNSQYLVNAYAQGVFPWYEEGQPILWWSPDPRSIITADSLHISKSMHRILKSQRLQGQTYHITHNHAFTDVIAACANARQHTWITEAMREAYCNLHKLGIAHSLEVWQHDQLIGGIYGIHSGSIFSGESMFSSISNASKVALINLCQNLFHYGFSAVDCQVPNSHTNSLGAIEISRASYLKLLKQPVKRFPDKLLNTTFFMQKNLE